MTGLKLEHAIKAGSKLRSFAQRINRREPAGAPVGVGSPRRRLRAVHISVLDGRTLNVCVELPSRTNQLPVALELVHDDTVLSLSMAVVRPAHGPARAEVAALLAVAGPGAEPLPGGLPCLRLEPGRWRLRVALAAPLGQLSRADVESAPELLSTGPTRADPASPDTAGLIRVDSTGDGRALLRVSRLGASAEVTRVELGWDRISIQGRPVGVPADTHDRLQAEASLRETGRVERIPLTWDGGRFAFQLPLERMVTPGSGEQIWDLRLLGADRTVKLGRRLTDIRSPKQVFRMPYRVLVVDGGLAVRAHVYYTQGGSLCLSCVSL